MAKTRQAIRMPGRVYNWYALEANRQREAAADTDLCDALARPRLKRRGRGFRATVLMELEQIERLMWWVEDSAPAYVREHRDDVRADLALQKSVHAPAEEKR